MEKVRKEARRKLDLLRKLRRWHKLVTVMAGVVVFCTTYALILPAITMTTPLVCEKEEHTHTDECYQIEMVPAERKLICELPEAEPHTHTDDCWTEVTVPACGLEETEGHTHTDDCYTEATTYVCGLEEAEGHAHTADCYTRTRGDLLCDKEFDTVERQVETVEERSIVDENGETVATPETVTETVTETVPHVHTDDCYAWTDELTCSLEETEGHAHTNECARTERVLTCELAEAEPHIHIEECGAETQKVLSCGLEETEGHAHTDECYEIPENEGELVEVRTLICEKEEHTHDDNCYYGLELEEKVKYYCGFDTQHTHDESCWFEDGELKCNIPEHTHTDECLVPPPVPVELDEAFTAESEDGAVVLNLRVTGTVYLPQELRTEPAEGEEPQETEEPGFELVLTESDDYDAYDEYTAMASKDGEILMVGVLDYALTYHGVEMDLSGCEVTVEVTPTEAFQAFMEDPETLETLGAMTMDLASEDDLPAEEDLIEALAPMFAAYTGRQGTVGYALTRGANPSFTVQYYAYLARAIRSTSGALPIIDTDNGSTAATANARGGKKPENGKGTEASPNGNPIAYLELENGQIKTTPQLTEIYAAQDLEYQKAPGLKYFNIVLKNTKSKYELTNIWVLKPGKQSNSIDPADWVSYPYNKDLTRFTNRPETAAADPENFILIDSGAVIRLVYGTTGKNENLQANFYDYNITDGRVYVTEADRDASRNPYFLGRQLADAKTAVANKTQYKYPDRTSTAAGLYVKTNRQGINKADLITAGGARLAFGNANTDMGLDGQTWTDSNGKVNALNVYNKSGLGGANSYKGCTFGLVTGLKDGKIQYASGVAAPSLFNESAATGKDTYAAKKGEKYSLNFVRVGDTYTLSSVEGTGATNLTKFNHPQFGTKDPYTHIWTNNFWPMDSAKTDYTDVQFGSVENSGLIWQGTNKWHSLPDSDDGKDHNPYFGMQFSVTFDLTKNYVGPLEYYFFGDDDMWVFLDDKLVCDIGGVHSSVGEYVNLWDYINKADLAGLKEDETKTYTLTFYYTERGASGSTCWMQFTLPTVVGLNLEKELEKQVDSENGSLWIQKELSGVENTDEFEFKLELEGAGRYDNYVIQGPNGEIITTGDGVTDYITNEGTFKLRGGAVLVVQKLPKGTQYKITEINNEGYHTQSETFLYSNEKKGGEFEKTVTTGTEAKGSITVNDITKVVFTNTASYELPATGGSGTTLWYTMGTMLLLGAAYLMYKKRQWLLREEDAM